MKIVQLTTDNREPHRDYDNPEPWFGAAPDALLQGLSQIDGIEVHVVSCIRREVTSSPKVYGNIHYHPVLVPKSGWLSSGYLGCIRATREVIRRIDPEIVHGQGTERECAMCAVHSGYPNVLTIHGNMAELNRLGITFQNNRFYGFLVSRLETHTLRKTLGTFCNSAYTESLVAPRSPKTWRVPNAIRGPFLTSPRNPDARTSPPILLNVGLICRRKRQLEILQALRPLHDEGLKFRMVFAGALGCDSYSNAFKQELAHAEACGYATFAGFLDEPELIALMDQARGFIHFPTEEAFGLVVAEAMARGLKFFGSRVGGIVEIADGTPGAEVHDDLPSLQHGIRHWLQNGAPDNPDATPEIDQRYSPLAVAGRHVEIYQSLRG